MSSKFASTLASYTQHAAQAAAIYEPKLGTRELAAFECYVPPGGYILDAGCAAGRDTAYFISHGYQAMGIDLSEGLLAEAKVLHPEVPTRLMSITELDFPDQTFDAIWCKAIILHLERHQIPGVVAGFHRVLKPGGVLYIQTKAGQGEIYQPASFNPEIQNLYTLYDERELVSLLEETDFAVLEHYTFNGKSQSQTARDINWVVVMGRKK